jgi:4-amino-4-deoxy-L-arabinose transferase-like glycosyltransferase
LTDQVRRVEASNQPLAVIDLPRAPAAPETPGGERRIVLGRRFWVTLLAVAFGVRAIVALGVLGSMPITSDALSYSLQASDFVHHRHGSVPYYWPPGTSYFLYPGYVLFGAHAVVARLMTIVASVLAVVTSTLLAARVLRDRRAVMATGFAVALAPEIVLMSSQPYSFDLTLLAVNTTALAALIGWETGHARWYALAGLSLGAGALTRPSTLSLALVLLGAGVVLGLRLRRSGRGRELRALLLGTAAAAVCAVVVIFPAARHNHAVGQGWTLSVNNDQNLWLGNNPYTPNYKTYWLGQHRVSHFPPATRAYMERFAYGSNPTPEQRRRARNEARRFVLAHPGVTALRTVNRVRAFWGFPYTISNNIRTDWHKGDVAFGAALLFEAGGYVLLGLLALAAAVFARPLIRRSRAIFVLALVAVFEIPYALDFSGGRWHYPVLGLLAPFAGAGIAWITADRDRWRLLLKSRPFLIAAAVFLALQAEYAYFVLRS